MSKSINRIFLKTTIVDMDDILRTPHLLQMCRNLSLGEGNPNSYSGMNSFLNFYSEIGKTRSIDACGIFAHYQDIPVGWVLYTYEDDQTSFRHRDGEACIHIYVKPDWRRHGIGRGLLQTAAKMAEPDIIRHYGDNNSFFTNVQYQNKTLSNLLSVYS